MIPENIKIMEPTFDFIVAYGIGSIAVLIAIIWSILIGCGNRKKTFLTLAISIFVMTGSAVIAINGKLTDFNSFPPPMVIMILGLVVMSFVMGLSPLGRTVVEKRSLIVLVGFQAFRFPLELIMHRASEFKIMPIQLSYSGFNFDIITGLTGLLLFILIRSGIQVPLKFIWIWNIWGSLCLIVILIIAVTTSPMVRLFGDQPENLNTWVLYFPYVWLPVVLVTIAITSHIIIWRKLLSKLNNNLL